MNKCPDERFTRQPTEPTSRASGTVTLGNWQLRRRAGFTPSIRVGKLICNVLSKICLPQVPMFPSQLQEKYDVFLSHASADKADYLDEIYERLRVDFQIRPFYDKHHLPPGGDFRDRIMQAMESCACVACFYGKHEPPAFFNSEIGSARVFEHLRGEEDGFLIPILLPGADTSKLHDHLAGRTYEDLRKGLDCSRSSRGTIRDPLHRIAEAIKLAVAKFTQIRPVPRQRDDRLSPRRLAILCGREEQSADIVYQVERSREASRQPVVVAIVRGTEEQLPREFVNRILLDSLPQLKMRPWETKIPCFFTSLKSHSGRDTPVASHVLDRMTREFANGCSKAGIVWKGRKVVPAIVDALRSRKCSYVVQVELTGSTIEALTSQSNAVCRFFAREEFKSLAHPIVVCILVNPQPPRGLGGFVRNLMGRFRPATDTQMETIETFSDDLHIVETKPPLNDVTRSDVARWQDRPMIQQFDPNVPVMDLESMYSEWQARFGDVAAPMQVAVKDLSSRLKRISSGNSHE